MSARGRLGLAMGFAAGNRRREQEAKNEAALERANRRQDESDARATEEYEYRKSQRPLQERANKLQIESAESAAEDARNKARDEGFIDLLDNLESGVDPGLAQDNYNRRGKHKIQGLQYDKASRTMRFRDEGGDREASTAQLRAALQSNLTNSQAPKKERKTLKLGDRERIVDEETGKVIATGPLYGKEKETADPRPISAGEGRLYDPKTKKWIIAPTPKKGKGGTAGDRESPYNPLTASAHTRQMLSDIVGLKLDPRGAIISEKKAGDSERFATMASRADELQNEYGRQLLPGQVAQLVSNAYRGVRSLQEIEKEVRQNTKRGKVKVEGKFFAQDEPMGDWDARIQKDVQAIHDREVDAAEKQLTIMKPALAAPDEGGDDAEAEGEVAPVSAADEEEALPAGAPTARRATGRGATAAQVIKPEQITGSDTAAVAKVAADARVLRALTSTEGLAPGTIRHVKIGDKLYYLAGTELREFRQ